MSDDGAMQQARALVERHIAVFGYVPHPDKIKEAIADSLRQAASVKGSDAQGAEPVAWGRVIDGKAVTVSLEWTPANDEPLYAGVVQAPWRPMETAPKDGRTFYAMRWYGSFEESIHWPLYWNGSQFEATNNGTEFVDDFTHWMIPAGDPQCSTGTEPVHKGNRFCAHDDCPYPDCLVGGICPSQPSTATEPTQSLSYADLNHPGTGNHTGSTGISTGGPKL